MFIVVDASVWMARLISGDVFYKQCGSQLSLDRAGLILSM